MFFLGEVRAAPRLNPQELSNARILESGQDMDDIKFS